jgi:hypothetical protein
MAPEPDWCISTQYSPKLIKGHLWSHHHDLGEATSDASLLLRTIKLARYDEIHAS